MNKLLGHLARFSSLSKQGELLCTQSLVYLLQNKQLERRFVRFISDHGNVSILESLIWRAEVTQQDGSRPDAIGFSEDASTEIRIEAKLTAEFGKSQLRSYLNGFDNSVSTRVLVVLVPQKRVYKVSEQLQRQFELQESSPWIVSSTKPITITVISWEDVFTVFQDTEIGELLDDVIQFKALYKVLNGDDLAPITHKDQLLDWRLQEEWWRNLLDQATRQIDPERVLPLGLESTDNPYYRRYIQHSFVGKSSFFSLGLCEPFDGHLTPLWLRFHKKTGSFSSIKESIEASWIGEMAIKKDGHLWFPIEVPYRTQKEGMLAAIIDQVRVITDIAYSGH